MCKVWRNVVTSILDFCETTGSEPTIIFGFCNERKRRFSELVIPSSSLFERKICIYVMSCEEIRDSELFFQGFVWVELVFLPLVFILIN